VGTHPSKVQGKREHKWTQTKEKKETINQKEKEKKEIKILSEKDTWLQNDNQQ